MPTYLFSILRTECSPESRAECMTNVRDSAMPIGNHLCAIALCLVCTRQGNDSASVQAIHKHTHIMLDGSSRFLLFNSSVKAR